MGGLGAEALALSAVFQPPLGGGAARVEPRVQGRLGGRDRRGPLGVDPDRGRGREGAFFFDRADPGRFGFLAVVGGAEAVAVLGFGDQVLELQRLDRFAVVFGPRQGLGFGFAVQARAGAVLEAVGGLVALGVDPRLQGGRGGAQPGVPEPFDQRPLGGQGEALNGGLFAGFVARRKERPARPVDRQRAPRGRPITCPAPNWLLCSPAALKRLTW